MTDLFLMYVDRSGVVLPPPSRRRKKRPPLSFLLPHLRTILILSPKRLASSPTQPEPGASHGVQRQRAGGRERRDRGDRRPLQLRRQRLPALCAPDRRRRERYHNYSSTVLPPNSPTPGSVPKFGVTCCYIRELDVVRRMREVVTRAALFPLIKTMMIR